MDLDGWFPVGAGFTAQAPQRTADTRPGQPVAFPAVKGPLPGARRWRCPSPASSGCRPTRRRSPSTSRRRSRRRRPSDGLPVRPGPATGVHAELHHRPGGAQRSDQRRRRRREGVRHHQHRYRCDRRPDGWFSGPQDSTRRCPCAPPTPAGTPWPSPPSGAARGWFNAGGAHRRPVRGACRRWVRLAERHGGTARRRRAPDRLPCGQQLPATSSLNYGNGQIVANAALAALGAGGRVCVTSSNSTEALVDLNGWFPR